MAAFKLASLSVRATGRRPLRSLIAAGIVAAGCTAVLLVWGVISGQRRALMGEAAETAFGALQVHARGYAKASDVLPVRPALEGVELWAARVAKLPGVRAVSPRLKFGAVVSAADEAGGGSATVMVTAFVEASERAVAPGRFVLMDRGAAGGVVLGAPLARALKVEPGAELAVLARDADGLLNGVSAPVSGTALPLLPTDRAAAWMPLQQAQELLRLGDACNELAVAVDDLDAVDVLRQRLQVELGPSVEVETWQQQLPGLADMVRNMRLSGLIVSFIIALVAAVGVFTTAALNVRDRTREIGTWLALGVRRRAVWGMFMVESALLGALGAGAGVALGALGAVAATRWGVPMKVPGTDVLVDVTPWLSLAEVAAVAGLAVALSACGAFVPAFRAARLEPVRALGDE